MENTPAIQVQALSKSFKTLKALDNVTFSVPSGSVFCILGPNGAGKTTLLRILTSVTQPSSGHVKIEGYDLAKDTLLIRNKIGVVAQENRFDKYISIWHNLTLHAQMHGLSKKVYEPRITDLLKKVDLYDRRDEMADHLSGGMQRRVALMRALIHEPTLLFLDEPTTGLDPEARIFIWQTIEALKGKATVILTTHYMEEADRLSDRIAMLNHGQIVAEGTAQSLKQALAKLGQYELVLLTPQAAEIKEKLTSLNMLTSVQAIDEYCLQFQAEQPEAMQAVLNAVPAEQVLRIGQSLPDLEDVFLSIARESRHAAF